MLTDIEIEKIKEKMKKEFTHSATLARRWGVSRQCVWIVLTKKGTSKNIENKFREYLNDK